MGGRITRAIYKNERTSQRLNAVQTEKSIQSIAKTLSLVTSSVATFLIGYLLRPHLQTQNTKPTTNQGETTINHPNIIILLIGLCLIFGTQIMNVIKRRDKYTSAKSSVQGNNKLLLLGCLICIVMEIAAWMTGYQLNTLLLMGYGIIWINMLNASLLIVRNAHGHSNNANQPLSYHQQNYQTQITSLYRTVFAYLSVGLLQLGQACSEFMKVMRIQKASKSMISTLIKQGSLIQPSLQSVDTFQVDTFQRLPLSYQSLVIESQHEQRIMIRITFLILISMIACVLIAFQKKSLAHLMLYERKKIELYEFYQHRFALSVDKDSRQQQFMERLMVDKIRQSMSLRRVGVASAIYIVGSVVIEYYRKSSYPNHTISYEGAHTTPFHSSLLILSVATLTYGTLKAIIYAHCRLFDCTKQIVLRDNQDQVEMGCVAGEKERSLWIDGKRNLVVTFIVMFVALQLIIQGIYKMVFEDGQTKSVDNSILFNSGNSEILFIFLTFFYIRLTKEQLIQFPQTSHQFYITITLTCTYLVRYFLPFQFLKALSQIVLGCTTQLLIRAVNTLLTMISIANESIEEGCKPGQFGVQCSLSIQLLISIWILVLIVLNEHIPIWYLLNKRMPIQERGHSGTNTPLIISAQQQRTSRRVGENQHEINNESARLLDNE